MVRSYYDLPSLTALAVFEASARHLSFKLAAAELNVTPGAVSRQIKAVEEELGVLLFTRLAAGVALTSAGEDLYGVLASSFSRAAEIVRNVKRGDRSKNVTLACTDAFASMWLIPRMPDFWTRYNDISVDHLISDSPREYRRAEVELRIRYGFGSWPDENAELLFDETIYPVCGPAFASTHRNATAESLADLPLLHVDWVDPDWSGWDEVLRRAGVQHGPTRGRRFGKFFVALQAAQADQGIAVGWHRLVKAQIDEGKLVRLTYLELPAPGGYYLTWNRNRTLSPAAERLLGWLREAAAQERQS
ncbi:LysR substrate-binding domain-containing protein [Mesorhizobium sp. M00.F.Ca.ET.217.01.1.1]|uniref:LysR substrate-binding domain-containing protein n=1 Tax=Mesorhizobium sp. M00.F.Ca.ET.217.01.1.1 TaxID=2500529 RepID=UPI000FDA2058|nr:LysR substrate-binding domain-containing protein [Mesorhizobium sp. M00.F.Ca.ET.217.01.1.1]TGQ18987.1 LysR family transcriptional regulator [Mesorhizobium sp. M00.F.Ca.ET.217.01.1.1]